jgi:hypothetical protein
VTVLANLKMGVFSNLRVTLFQTVDEIETCKTRIISTDGNEIVRRMSTSSSDDVKTDVTDVETSKIPTARSMSMYERGPLSLGHLTSASQNVVKVETKTQKYFDEVIICQSLFL